MNEPTTDISPSEAVYAFVAHLTTSEPITMGCGHDCVPACDSIKEFSEKHDLADPRDGWERGPLFPNRR